MHAVRVNGYDRVDHARGNVDAFQIQGCEEPLRTSVPFNFSSQELFNHFIFRYRGDISTPVVQPTQHLDLEKLGSAHTSIPCVGSTYHFSPLEPKSFKLIHMRPLQPSHSDLVPHRCRVRTRRLLPWTSSVDLCPVRCCLLEARLASRIMLRDLRILRVIWFR